LFSIYCEHPFRDVSLACSLGSKPRFGAPATPKRQTVAEIHQ
jgi:hypothetical protein